VTKDAYCVGPAVAFCQEQIESHYSEISHYSECWGAIQLPPPPSHSPAKAISVLKIGWVLAMLCAACWFASEVRLPNEVAPSSASEQMVWRRTADGWEKMDGWAYGIERTTPALHPGVFGLLMIAATLSVGIVRQEDRRSCPSSQPAQHAEHDR
jgi:hypothetical protein